MSQHDEKSIGIVKTIVYKIVAERKECVIESYQVVRDHSKRDRQLHKWIKCGLQNLQKELDPNRLYAKKIASKNAKVQKTKIDFWPKQGVRMKREQTASPISLMRNTTMSTTSLDTGFRKSVSTDLKTISSQNKFRKIKTNEPNSKSRPKRNEKSPAYKTMAVQFGTNSKYKLRE